MSEIVVHHSDMENLIDLFLDPEYEPKSQRDPVVGNHEEGPEEADEEEELRAVGRAIARMGDNPFQAKSMEIIESLKSLWATAVQKGQDEEVTWQSYKNIMNPFLLDPPTAEVIQISQGFFLILNAVKSLGQGLMEKFSKRLIEENTQLANNIKRGLEATIRQYDC